jgi:hypothetical protein
MSSSAPSSDPALFIQAHEAEVIRGPQARIAAASLEVGISESSRLTVGDGLIKWGGERPNATKMRVPVNVAFDGEDSDDEWKDESEAVWVDRYALSE